MVNFGVSDKKEKELINKMRQLGIKESDLVEKFIRSSGKGGQKTNKSSTCVYLKHLPTKIEVKCQRERSQSVNRFLARRILAQRIENMVLGKKSEQQRKIEKIRKQKQRRKKRAKDWVPSRILAGKC